MVVAGGPVQQRRAKVVHAVPDGCDVVGRGAGAAVAHGPQPDLDGGADVRGEAVEFAFKPTFEGSPPVVDEHAHLLEHLPDPFDTDRQRTQRREDLGVVHLVARGVPGQDDDQCPADIEPRSPSPAAGLASTVGQVDRPGQPWVAQVGVVALVEPGEVSAGFEQSWLGPPDAGTDGWRRRQPSVPASGGPSQDCSNPAETSPGSTRATTPT